MQYQVPQFIEVEDKIFGPLSFKQFLYVAGGTGISFVIFSTMPLFVAVLLIIPIATLSLALAFYKVNEKPFIHILEAAFKYFLGEKLYLWKQQKKNREEETKKKQKEDAENAQPDVPKLADSKLKDLAWELDVHKNVQ